MAHKAARKSRQHGEMLTETTLNCRKLLENSLETNRLCWMTEMARLFSIALADWGREDDSTAARLRPMLRRIGRAGANARHEGTRALKVKLKLDLP